MPVSRIARPSHAEDDLTQERLTHTPLRSRSLPQIPLRAVAGRPTAIPALQEVADLIEPLRPKLWWLQSQAQAWSRNGRTARTSFADGQKRGPTIPIFNAALSVNKGVQMFIYILKLKLTYLFVNPRRYPLAAKL